MPVHGIAIFFTDPFAKCFAFPPKQSGDRAKKGAAN
jgi:hypothetical protein